MKYTLSEISAMTGGTLSGQDRTVDSVTIDSRSHQHGDDPLFVAIRGRNHDGHDFISQLYSRGNRSFMVERGFDTTGYPEAGFVAVDDSVKALQTLAARHRDSFRGIMVGITGSNGKTVVKEWIAALIPPEVKMFRSPKSYNSRVGVPLSILMMDNDEEIALIEAGISEPGEMDVLERIIRPDVGVITTIGDAHQENFDTIEEKTGEKLRLFRNSKTIVYNSGYREVAEALGKTYPTVEMVDSAAMGDTYSIFGDQASSENAAMAAVVCEVLGADPSATSSRLRGLEPVAMRLELREGINDSLIVNDSYNSDINSLAIALDYLNGVAGGRPRALIISDILQSGFAEGELYYRVAKLVNRSGVETVIGIGERIKLYGEFFESSRIFYPTTDSFLSSFRRDDIAGHAVLVKGNRASQFERISHALENKSHTTSLEIDLDAMIHNLNVHRKQAGRGTKIMAMVKAAGYGTGTYEIAGMLQNQGVDYLAVAFADEGVLLRKQGISIPIVVLNADSDSFELMIANSLEPEIYNFTSLRDFLAAIKRYGEREYPVHIKLDTGMHRLGFLPGDLGELAEKIKSNSQYIRVGSIFSHLASADCADDDEFTEKQISDFDRFSWELSEELGYRPLRHIANSAGIERFPGATFDMVRLGIGLYGVSSDSRTGLMPVSRLVSRIVQIKDISPGETVGYGREGVADKPTRIAIIPVGYADGLDRRLGCGRWKVTVNGQPAPTIGRISMDTCAVEVTGITAAEGDRAVIFGDEQGHLAEDMARVLDTIPYEVMTGISPRVKRIYMKD